MNYRIAKKGEKFIILVRTNVTKKILWLKNQKSTWVKANDAGQPITNSFETFPQFTEMNEAITKIDTWSK